jgi:pimeloyl-ACP methyl ester carboxylesterase
LSYIIPISIILSEECDISKTYSTSPRKLKIIKVTSVILAVILVLYISLSIFGAVAAMVIPRLPVNGSPSSVGLAYENVAFHSRGDGVLLKGWFITGKSNMVLIVVHGGFANRLDYVVDTLNLTHDLVGRGYNVLLFDLRGRGESSGKGRSLSNIDRDIGGAVDYVVSRGFPPGKTGIIGFCSGAASATIFASRNNVGALVLDGCFTSVQKMVDRQAAQRKIPLFFLDFFWPGVLQSGKYLYKFRLINPIEVISDVRCPVLFIHEEYDDLVTLEDTYLLLEKAGNSDNELWQIKGAKHSEGYTIDPTAFLNKIDTFLSSRLGSIITE